MTVPSWMRSSRATDPQADGIHRAEYRVIGIEDGVNRWVSSYGETTFMDGKGSPAKYPAIAADCGGAKSVLVFITMLESMCRCGRLIARSFV
jgi:hypothetical protein